MQFGPFDPELTAGARNAISTCLAVQPGERVALSVDEACREIGASLAAAAAEAGARWTGYVIEDLTTRPMIDPPVEIMQALATCDVGILCVHPREGELHTRMRIVAAVEQRQIRYAHMVGVTPAIMQQGMRADYRLVDRLSERVRERMRTARRLEVRTDAGTEIAATFDPSLAWVKTSGLISRRYCIDQPGDLGEPGQPGEAERYKQPV